MSSSVVDNLTTEQKEIALRFLLYRMGQDTRGEMMAAIPVIYRRLFPSVGLDVLLIKVASAIDSGTDRGQSNVTHG